MTDPAIAGTSRFGPSADADLHQAVLSSGRNVATESGWGTHILTWGGTGSPSAFPPVIQDTDGYSGTAGDSQWGGPAITALTIPAGLGGTYAVGIEQASTNNAWWIISGSPPYPNPQPGVPYIPSNGDVSLGDQVVVGPVSVAFEIRVNGSVVASDMWTYGGGLAYVRSEGHISTTIALNDGDVVTASFTSVGIEQDNALGGQWPGEDGGFMFLTRLFGPGGKAFLRGHVAL